MVPKTWYSFPIRNVIRKLMSEGSGVEQPVTYDNNCVKNSYYQDKELYKA